MDEISKKDLEHLTNEQIKSFYTEKTLEEFPSPIREYIEDGKKSFIMGPRLNRVESLLNLIIVERFLNDKL